MADIPDQKNEILTALLKLMILLGGTAYIPSIYVTVKEELWLLAIVDTAAYIIVVAAGLSRRMKYKTRLRIVVVTTLFIGGAVLFATGNNGAGHLWLLCGVVISALFGSTGIIVFTICLSEATMAGYAFLMYMGFIPVSASPESIIVIASNLLVISIALTMITHKLLGALVRELENRDKLLRLMHHRVKNNLQNVESLLALENNTEGILDACRLSRRISALSAANHLLLGEYGCSAVAADDLMKTFLRPGMDRLLGHDDRLVVTEKVSEAAIVLSDLFAFHQSAGCVEVEMLPDSSLFQFILRSELPDGYSEREKAVLKEQILAGDNLLLDFRKDGCLVTFTHIK